MTVEQSSSNEEVSEPAVPNPVVVRLRDLKAQCDERGGRFTYTSAVCGEAIAEIERLVRQLNRFEVHRGWAYIDNEIYVRDRAAPETDAHRLRRVSHELAEIALRPPREANRTELAQISGRILALAGQVELGERIDPPRLQLETERARVHVVYCDHDDPSWCTDECRKPKLDYR